MKRKIKNVCKNCMLKDVYKCLLYDFNPVIIKWLTKQAGFEDSYSNLNSLFLILSWCPYFDSKSSSGLVKIILNENSIKEESKLHLFQLI